MYHAGLRVSEVVGLQWAHVRETTDGAVLDIFGKGDEQRYVLISKAMLDELYTLDGRFVGKDRFVFQSRKGKAGTQPMDTRQVDRIVLTAARRAGIQGNVSAHWLRHANASHALDNGAPIHVVQQSLGHASLVTTTRYAHIKPGTGSSQYIKV
jgi:integrase/recombinase XerD